MPSFLMWQYKSRNTGEFHAANTAAARTKMLGKGFVDITGMQVWDVPYPIDKSKADAQAVPPQIVKPESPAETLPAEETPTAPEAK